MNNIEKIAKIVASYYNISESKMRGIDEPTTRQSTYKDARYMCYLLCKEFARNKSLSDVGSIIAGQDHATVIHGIKTIKNLISTEKKLKDDYEKLYDICYLTIKNYVWLSGNQKVIVRRLIKELEIKEMIKIKKVIRIIKNH